MSIPTPPERIWLQFYDVYYPDEEAGEITWCIENVNETDVEYIRADILHIPVVPDHVAHVNID